MAALQTPNSQVRGWIPSFTDGATRFVYKRGEAEVGVLHLFLICYFEKSLTKSLSGEREPSLDSFGQMYRQQLLAERLFSRPRFRDSSNSAVAFGLCVPAAHLRFN